jgi:AmmeMemoRadiSam system protein B
VKLWLTFFVLIAIGLLVVLQPKRSLSIAAVVLPHHDIVRDQRHVLLEHVRQRIGIPRTIILVSPNHYESGYAAIQTTSQIWETSRGIIPPNLPVIQALEKASVREEPGSFINEHGIRNLVGDIAELFPGSMLVPIILKSSAKTEDIKALEGQLVASCDDCVLFASVDFSHYQPASLANLHDIVSIRALSELDSNALEKAEVDSGSALELTANWARLHGATHFNLQNHTNSGVLLHSPDIETTSHVFGWYEPGAINKVEPTATFLVSGATEPIKFELLKLLGGRTFWGADRQLDFSSVGILDDRIDIADLSVRLLGIDLAKQEPSQLTVKIQTASQTGQRVIVLAKGEVDDVALAGKAWTDAGASLVIGNNGRSAGLPIAYKNGLILTSIGPLSVEGVQSPTGMLVAGSVTQEGIRLSLLPLTWQDSMPLLLRASVKQETLQKLALPTGQFAGNSQNHGELFIPF